MLNQITTQTSVKVPQLQAPGAGLPWYHNLMLKYYVGPFVAGRSDWNVNEQTFHKVNGRILKEIESLTEKQLSTKILVPPQLGLEDSSRYWSVAMVLEHLVIVTEQVYKGVIELSNGRVPPVKVDIAKVKPLGSMPPLEAVEEFKLLVSEDFKKFLLQVGDKNSKLTLLHPWFGPFKARQWFWLLGMHHGLHLKQIREIKKRLSMPEIDKQF
ncbi:MAG: hypothetical protein K0R29_2432 [Pseudobdellovibrio sp.]|nr:hypothetical protein [Pseudobdellovibrio sp.]